MDVPRGIDGIFDGLDPEELALVIQPYA
jgi:hypothetical protein